MDFKYTEWKSCMEEKPERDGEYLVYGVYRGNVTYATMVKYTQKYGWNADETSHEHAIDYSDEVDRVYIWSEVSVDGNKEET